MARDFVRGCLNKIPNLRPTYSMLLEHPWLASLSKPHSISEEDGETASSPDHTGTEDPEVAEWVKTAIERKKNGLMGESKKPALHAAPLDTVSPAASPG
jgi:mitogen-activated protein kinase kinase